MIECKVKYKMHIYLKYIKAMHKNNLLRVVLFDIAERDYF